MLIYSNNFNLKHIADSGQCFRMNPVAEDKYCLIAYDKYIELTQVTDNCIELSCSEEDYNKIWKNYFDLDFNYEQIVTGLSEGEDEFLKNAAKFGNGLRILKQDVYETLISFIISQRKNIPAIKNCIEILCVKYGKKKISSECRGKEYYTFPSPESLANASAQELKKTGLGYRDSYILKTSQSVLKGDIDLKALRELSFEETLKQLQTLSGVGIKVANCVALYGLHHIEAFPIDVWIARILKDIYNDQFNLEPYNGFAGIVQQYMFYYIRNKK